MLFFKIIILVCLCCRFSMYPPSMLSSAALAHAAQDLNKSSGLQFNVNELINRLQILTQVENVSRKSYYLFILTILLFLFCLLFVMKILYITPNTEIMPLLNSGLRVVL